MSGTRDAGGKDDLSVARALTWRYVIALVLVASLSSAAWISLHLVIEEQQSTAAVVNVSGRQRMLSQRIALFSNLLVNAPQSERTQIRARLKDAVDLMERSHHALTHGDEALGLSGKMSDAVRAMYFDGPDALDAGVDAYIGSAREFLLLEQDAPSYDTPSLRYLTRQASTTLLESLDRMVRQYQREGEASVGRLQRAETIFWLVTLSLLMLEALLIFRPFARHVRDIIGRLQDASDALRSHQEQLELAVTQRTAELESRTRAMIESEEKFRLISTVAKDAIVIVGEAEKVVYWNPAAEKILGYAANEAIGRNLHELITPMRYREDAHRSFGRFSDYGVGSLIGKTFEIAALHKDGREFPVELSISAFRFHNDWHALGLIRDITERKQMEEQVRQLAFYDTLTSLPNRRLLNDRLSQAMAACRRSGWCSALLFLDLDNFKPLNDRYGHVIGDLLLIEVAQRLKGCVRENDTVARFGGDEFVVVLGELAADHAGATAQAGVVAQKISAALSAPYLLNISRDGSEGAHVEHRCTTSIGAVVFTSHECSADDVLKWADDAMYRAKEAGGGQVRFFDQPG